MTAPFTKPFPKSFRGLSARELLSAERTGDDPGPTLGTGGPLVVAVPVKNGADVAVFSALGSGTTDPGWPVVRYDSRNANQIRAVATMTVAGSAGSEAFATYWNGSAFVTPGVTDVTVPISVVGAQPNADTGWVTLLPAAVGDKLWRGDLRGGDGAASPAIHQFHLQFRQRTAPPPPLGTPPDVPTGAPWGNIIFDANANGPLMQAQGYANNADVPLWPDETAFANDLTTSAVLLRPKFHPTGFNGSRPCVEWNGANVPLLGDNPSLAYGSWTYYLIIENLDGGGDGSYIWGDQGNSSFCYRLHANNNQMAATCNILFGGLTTFNDTWGMSNPHIYRFVKSAGDSHWRVFVDGVMVANVANAPQTNDTTLIQLMNYVSGIGLTGRVGRVLGYDTAHNSPTNGGGVADGATAVETALSSYWGTP